MSNAKAASAVFLPCGISCGHRASSWRRCCISGRRRAFKLCIHYTLIAQEARYKCHLTMFLNCFCHAWSQVMGVIIPSPGSGRAPRVPAKPRSHQ